MIDSAAMNPLLQQQYETPYFRACAREREQLRSTIADSLGIYRGRVFITSNTSSGFVGVLGAATVAGACVHPQGAVFQHFPGYRQILTDLGHSWSDCCRSRIDFHTHVAPTTGLIDESISLSSKDRKVVVDGAQSFGTALTSELIEHSDVALAPLHKHFMGAPGLGIAIVAPAIISDDSPLLRVLTVIEQGCVALEILKRANGRMATTNVWNYATLNISSRETQVIDDLGLEVINDDRRLPMRCLRPIRDIPVRTLLPGPLVNGRHFEQDNTIRFSFWRTGSGDRPDVDCADDFMDALRVAAQPGATA